MTVLCLNLLVWSAVSALCWSPMSMPGRLYPGLDSSGQAEAFQIMKRIPPAASVSEQAVLGPWLSHRSRIYCFPNPFVQYEWGGSVEALRELAADRIRWPSQSDLERAFQKAPVEYVALQFSYLSYTMNLNVESEENCLKTLLECPSYGLVYIGDEGLLFKRGADHAAGLRMLSRRSGIAIHSSADLLPAVYAWKQPVVRVGQ